MGNGPVARKRHGTRGRTYITEQVTRLAHAGGTDGVAMWCQVARRLDALSTDTKSSMMSGARSCGTPHRRSLEGERPCRDILQVTASALALHYVLHVFHSEVWPKAGSNRWISYLGSRLRCALAAERAITLPST
jgi:hypothetical protein